tara:strand:+ start:256 stop:741 length:486 start_codon:yes stop_codon:yes gene_type:complete
MANGRIGSHPSHGYSVVEKITDTEQLKANDSGKVFICYAKMDGNYAINLPKMRSSLAGWHAKFILQGSEPDGILHGNDDAVQILCYGQPAGGGSASSSTVDANIVYCVEIGATEAGAANEDGIAFGADATTEGVSIEIRCDGTNWYGIGFGKIANDIVTVD